VKKRVWWEMKSLSVRLGRILNFVIRGPQYDEVERRRQRITMLHSILNRTSKIMNYISIIKLIKKKLSRKMVVVCCDLEKVSLKKVGAIYYVIYFQSRWRVCLVLFGKWSNIYTCILNINITRLPNYKASHLRKMHLIFIFTALTASNVEKNTYLNITPALNF
jgi:hypothetical protein